MFMCIYNCVALFRERAEYSSGTIVYHCNWDAPIRSIYAHAMTVSRVTDCISQWKHSSDPGRIFSMLN